MPNIFDQFDQPQARLAPQPPAVGGNIFDQFDDAPELKPETPAEQQERSRLQAELDQYNKDAPGQDRKIAAINAFDAVARPTLRGLTDLAESQPIVAIPKMLANLGVSLSNKTLGTRLSGIPEIAPKELAARTDADKLGSAVTRGIGGAAGGIGVGQSLAGAGPVLGRIGASLAANPGLQAAGAVTGAGSGELARYAGAGPVGQTVASIAGGLLPSTLAQATVRTANKAATGLTRTPEAQRLLDAGVDLTPGQLNPRGTINQLEESLQSVPLVGQVIGNARNNAKDTFRRAAVQQGAAPGATIVQADKASMLDDAYQSFKPLYDQAKGFPVSTKIINTGSPDVPLSQAFAAGTRSRSVLATADDRAVVQDFLDDQLTKPIRNSEDLIDLRSDIRAKAREVRLRSQPDRAELLDKAEEAVTKALESQLPAKPLQALRTADAKYGEYKTLEKAVASSGDRELSATDLSRAVASGARGSGQGDYARGGGGKLRELAADGKEVFDTKSPPTGARLAGIGLSGAALTATNPVLGGALGAGALGLIGTQTGRRIAQGVTPAQQALRQRLGPAQKLIADPYNEQLALALQQAIELRRRQESQPARGANGR